MEAKRNWVVSSYRRVEDEGCLAVVLVTELPPEDETHNVAMGAVSNLHSHAALVEACKAALEMIDDGLYEQEYDGRMFTLCRDCNYQDDVRPEHHPNCKFRRLDTIRAALAQAEPGKEA